MQENFLHFIWQYQYFNKDSLKDISGETINILYPGYLNRMSGPDFLESRIKIGDLSWNGQVEIHINSSDWDNHRHYKDPAYNNVVLHVVWDHDKEVHREDGTVLPTIELKDRVEKKLLDEYEDLISTPKDILCHSRLSEIADIEKIGMIEKALISRLENKSNLVLSILEQNGNDWEETAYQLLARGFGFKTNGEAFYELSCVLPVKVIFKHTDSLFQLEAMLFGQAGLLTGRSKDSYHRSLQEEFKFLKNKYDLPENMLKASRWKMGRLRPANFPTVRIAQLAAVLFNIKNVFSSFLNADSLQKLRFILRSTPNDYWKNHYLFGEETTPKSSTPGLDSIDRLIINVVAPLLAGYSKYVDDQRFMDQAVTVLQQLKPEKNAIIKRWEEVHIKPASAADTQGLIELYNSFCLKKRCLSCNIGTTILKTVTG